MKFSREDRVRVAVGLVGLAALLAFLRSSPPLEQSPWPLVGLVVCLVGALVAVSLGRIFSDDQREQGRTLEQLEARSELRAFRRSRYLAARFGTGGEEQQSHAAFNELDALRRRAKAEDGARRLAEVEAELEQRREQPASPRSELGAGGDAPGELTGNTSAILRR
jgi:hypothetical protein